MSSNFKITHKKKIDISNSVTMVGSESIIVSYFS